MPSRSLALGILWLAALLFPGARPATAASAPRPPWTLSTPRADGLYKYYVGRASHAPDETEGFNLATRDALDRAILENFGFRTRVESESYETLDKATAIRRVDELSRNVEIHGFEQVDSFKQEVKNGVDLWLLFRYSKSAIAVELARLARDKQDDDPHREISEIGGARQGRGTRLEITSEPPGAGVLVDGEPAGLLTTPLRIVGQLPPGKHSVRIEHPRFEPVEEDVVLLPGKTARIHVILSGATAWLEVITLPPGARAEVNGKGVGFTPTECEVPAGTPVRLVLTHPETEPISREVEVGRDETRVLRIDLPRRPGYLSVLSEPRDAQVRIDGRPFGKGSTPTGSVRLEPGDHKLELRKEGYEAFHTTVSLRGGERKHLPTIRLMRRMRVASNDAGDRESFPTLIPRVLLPLPSQSEAKSPARPKAESPSWMLRLPILYSRSASPERKDPRKDSKILYGFAFDLYLLRDLGLQLGYSRSSPGAETATPAAQGLQAGVIANLARDLLFSHDILRLEAEWGYWLTAAVSVDSLRLSPPSGAQEIGGRLGYGWLFALNESPLFALLSFTGGAQRYFSSTTDKDGTTSLSMGIEVALGF